MYRALENIKSSCHDVYKLNDIPSDYYSTDIFKRLRTAVDFVKDAVNLIGEQQNLTSTILRERKNRRHPVSNKDFYDYITELMFEIIFLVASVKSPPDSFKCWDIHHNTVWGEFFSPLRGGGAWRIMRFKLHRLLYDEILNLEKFPNYKSSAILGFCLNVMGLELKDKKVYGKEYYPLHKAIIAWTRKNYLRLKNIHPEVAKSCLIGSISFDEQGNRLVKTYPKHLHLEAPKDYLELSSTV